MPTRPDPRARLPPIQAARRPVRGRLRCMQLLTTVLSLVGCTREDAEQPADAMAHGDSSPHFDGATTSDAGHPGDALPETDGAAADADPRSLAPLWAPDFGPPPADMPEEIRWMHGRMWCDAPRPPRTLPDGTSECAFASQNTPLEFQVEDPDDPDAVSQASGCREWPYRQTELGFGGPAGIDSWLGCSPDWSVCCTFDANEEFLARPCGWSYVGFAGSGVSALPPEMESALPWLEARGLRALVPGYAPETGIPDRMVDVWQTALNNCHPVCRRPACGP